MKTKNINYFENEAQLKIQMNLIPFINKCLKNSFKIPISNLRISNKRMFQFKILKKNRLTRAKLRDNQKTYHRIIKKSIMNLPKVLILQKLIILNKQMIRSKAKRNFACLLKNILKIYMIKMLKTLNISCFALEKIVMWIIIDLKTWIKHNDKYCIN